jgi:hypothetical protein
MFTTQVRLEKLSIPEPNSGCLLWMGAHNGLGYGRMYLNKSYKYAHRVSYEIERGPIPEGMMLDHLCRNPSCINPYHLEPVSNAENTRRGRISALRPMRTRCWRGHSLAKSSYVDTQGHLQCRECTRIRQRAYYVRKKSNVYG